jgi:16S rRNA G966 N2-methylase RsmD
LAANIKKSDHETLFPAYGIKTFKQGNQVVKVGFVGMTLKNTPNLVIPEGIKGLKFEDEAATANALVPLLKAQGVSALVLVIHEGGVIQGGPNDASCPGLSGDIVPILNKLDTGFDVVFIDPPFRKGLAKHTIELLMTHGWLNNDALIYLETENDVADIVIPASWQPLKEKKAGQVSYRLFTYQAES